MRIMCREASLEYTVVAVCSLAEIDYTRDSHRYDSNISKGRKHVQILHNYNLYDYGHLGVSL